MELEPKDFIKSELNPEPVLKSALTLQLEEAIADFYKKQEAKSFSGRHPELGKMIKCQICQTRHRSAHTCQQRFAKKKDGTVYGELTPPDGLTGLTKNQVIGRAAFAKKRINPHYSKKRLQLVDLTKQLFPLHDGIWPSTETKSAEFVSMQVARREAREILAAKRNAVRSEKQSTQHRSRRINRGLLPGNARIHR